MLDLIFIPVLVTISMWFGWRMAPRRFTGEHDGQSRLHMERMDDGSTRVTLTVSNGERTTEVSMVLDRPTTDRVGAFFGAPVSNARGHGRAEHI